VGFALTAAYDIRHTDAGTTATWFHAINYADTVKLMLLGGFCGGGHCPARETMSCWLRITGRILVPLLIIGGLDVVAANPACRARPLPDRPAGLGMGSTCRLSRRVA
jgi:hypothetical protein